MNTYSEDLRKKIVDILRRGTAKSETTRSFGFSLYSVKRYARMAQEGRPLAPKKATDPCPTWARVQGGFREPMRMLSCFQAPQGSIIATRFSVSGPPEAWLLSLKGMILA